MLNLDTLFLGYSFTTVNVTACLFLLNPTNVYCTTTLEGKSQRIVNIVGELPCTDSVDESIS